MSDPTKPKYHLLKGTATDGAKIAVCGKTVHAHLISKDAALVSCSNCLKWMIKNG